MSMVITGFVKRIRTLLYTERRCNVDRGKMGKPETDPIIEANSIMGKISPRPRQKNTDAPGVWSAGIPVCLPGGRPVIAVLLSLSHRDIWA